MFGLNDPEKVEKYYEFKHKRSILNTNFILESVKELKKNLRAIGSDLFITMEYPHEYIKQFIRNDRKTIVIIDREISYEERQCERQIIKMAFENNIKICKTWSSTIFHINDLPIPNWKFPHLFGRFKSMIADIQPRMPLEPPIDNELPIPDPELLLNSEKFDKELVMKLTNYVPRLIEFGYDENEFSKLEDWKISEESKTHPIIPGEEYGLKRLSEVVSSPYLFQDHFYTKNKLFQDKLRKLDLYPWLSSGCISPRRLYSELENVGTAEFKKVRGQLAFYKIDLLWKDFLKFWALKNKNSFFTSEYGVYDRDACKWENDSEILKRFQTGTTGMPMIDALCRSLIKTGYISARGRMIFAHYFSQDLKQDWRIGAHFFQSNMLEFEP